MWFVTNIIMLSFLATVDNIAIATDKTKVNGFRFLQAECDGKLLVWSMGIPQLVS